MNAVNENIAVNRCRKIAAEGNTSYLPEVIDYISSYTTQSKELLDQFINTKIDRYLKDAQYRLACLKEMVKCMDRLTQIIMHPEQLDIVTELDKYSWDMRK